MSISVEATGKYYTYNNICVPYAASKLGRAICGDTFEM